MSDGETDDERKRTAACIAACVTAMALFDENARLSGEFACSVCGGTVRYSVARSNGHTAGRCETGGCVSWLQ